MEQQQKIPIEQIREYTKENRQHHDDPMDFDASTTETRLEQTLRELQGHVREQQAALEELRSQSSVDLKIAAYASEDPHRKLEQFIAVRDAYQRLQPTPTFLPSQGSMLPALLAARTLSSNVERAREAIQSTQSQITNVEATLTREEANLHDTNLLTRAMENRINRLRAQHEDRSQKTPAQLTRELMAAKRARKEGYDAEMQHLGEAMDDFINDYLSGMIAAEELGGPVVGDMLDVEDDALAAGFTKKGRAKSSKKPVSSKSRQRRIDQIWGNKATVDDKEGPPIEAEAADAEMRQLIEDLFAMLIQPGGSKEYYQLERDSAASRFLVRAKIAQFHPKDARKLRLIDFGRALDD
ncbi:Nn.00g050190.m01.CDS01 [Neocucurbitaria sp. VM-36]